jgi:hypothetical protein
MEEIKNVIVEQKDIFNLIKYLEGYFKNKQEMFDATEAAVKQEEAAQAEWSKQRFDPNYTNVPEEFNYQLFHNKRDLATLTVDISYVDGSSTTGKSVAEFVHSLNTKEFQNITSLTINMNISYKRDYKANDYTYDPHNRISQDVYIKFSEDFIYYTISGENCDHEVTELKTYVLDMFDRLSPKLTTIITKRNKIKFVSTLFLAFLFSSIITALSVYFLKDTIISLNLGNLKYLTIAVYLVLSLILNAAIPPFKLSQLYSNILPKKMTHYDTSKKEMVTSDNLQDFVSSPEVQIGSNAKKANIRQEITRISKQRKILAAIFFIVGLIATAAATFLFI